MDKIIEKFRRLTFKDIKGYLTESEQNWLHDATKAIYGGCGGRCMCGGRYPQKLSAYMIEKLGG